MENFEFLHPQILYWEFTLLIFLLLYIIVRAKHKQNLRKFASSKVLAEIANDYAPGKLTLKFTLIAISLSLIILALARPQYANYTVEENNPNVEITIALDISNSMLVKDQGNSLSRIDQAKNAIYRLIEKLHGEKLSLIIFAGNAAIQIPRTTDYNAFRNILQSINPSFISTQGTNIGEAIKLGIKTFSENSKKIKALILLSDGEDHQGNISEAIKQAKDAGIKIYTVGIGSPAGNPIYLNNKLLRDENGQVVISKLNEAILQQIANQTNGKYFHLGYDLNALIKIYKEIEKQSTNEKIKIKKKNDKFHYFALPAIILLFFEFFILERTNRWLSKFEIFQPRKNF